jgi:hypothetical protein
MTAVSKPERMIVLADIRQYRTGNVLASSNESLGDRWLEHSYEAKDPHGSGYNSFEVLR